MVGCFSLYANEFCDEHAIYLISLESRSLNFRVFIHMYSLLLQRYFIFFVANTRTKSVQEQIRSIDVDKVGSKTPLASKSCFL